MEGKISAILSVFDPEHSGPSMDNISLSRLKLWKQTVILPKVKKSRYLVGVQTREDDRKSKKGPSAKATPKTHPAFFSLMKTEVLLVHEPMNLH